MAGCPQLPTCTLENAVQPRICRLLATRRCACWYPSRRLERQQVGNHRCMPTMSALMAPRLLQNGSLAIAASPRRTALSMLQTMARHSHQLGCSPTLATSWTQLHYQLNLPEINANKAVKTLVQGQSPCHWELCLPPPGTRCNTLAILVSRAGRG